MSPRLQLREARAYPALTDVYALTRAAPVRAVDFDAEVATQAAGTDKAASALARAA